MNSNSRPDQPILRASGLEEQPTRPNHCSLRVMYVESPFWTHPLLDRTLP